MITTKPSVLALLAVTASATAAAAAAPLHGPQLRRAAPPHNVQLRRADAILPIVDRADLGIVTRVIMAGDPIALPIDSPADRVDPNVAASPYSGVCGLLITRFFGTGICSGTPIDRRHVLTAAHCFDWDDDGVNEAGTNVTLTFNVDGDESHVVLPAGVASVELHPDFTGFDAPSLNDDLAMITLVEPLPESIPVYAPFRGELEDSQLVTLVGYGRSGYATTGANIPASTIVKRKGGNRADAFMTEDDSPLQTLEVFVADFDPPAEALNCSGGFTLGNDIETSAAPGDSGGPAFVPVDGAHHLYGVNTFIASCTGPGAGFGGRTGGIVVNAYLPWIDEFIVCQNDCSDCNSNGVFDGVELVDDGTLDTNGDGILDECQILSPGDVWSAASYAIRGFRTDVGAFVIEQPTMIDTVKACRSGRDGLMYLCGNEGSNHGLFRFDAATGALVDQPIGAAQGADWPADVAFGADGWLYVLNRGGYISGPMSITRHDPVSGALIDTLVADDAETPELENAGITSAESMAFGPDGDIYVTALGYEIAAIARFDGQTGAFLGEFGTDHPGFGGFRDVGFRGGFMYAANVSTSSIFRFDAHTGAFVDVFISPDFPAILPLDRFQFTDEGDLITLGVSFDAQILRWDGAGMLIEELFRTDFTSRFGLVLPEPGPGDVSGDGSVGFFDLTLVLINWGPCAAGSSCPADQNDDGVVGFADMIEVLLAWDPR